MPIIRIQKRENPYVQIDRAAIEDNRLSWRSRGILAYLLSKPDTWCINVFDIVNHGTEGRDAVQKSLKELKQFGYAKLQTTRDEKGRVTGKEWVITEEPINGFSVDRSESPTNGITDVGKNRKTANPLYSNNKKNSNNKKTRSVSEKETDEGAESFEQLWQAYGMKKGSKKTALARWGKLSRADRENIWATLDLYKRETVTEDTADRAGKFKPMRKHLERFLSARTWEAYIDRAADQKSEPPTPFDENYQKYLDWVKQHFPQVLQQTTQLSRAQFVAFKSTSYVKGVRDIGTNGEMSMFKQAHADFCQASTEARKFSDVYEYHCSLIRYRVKVRQV